MSVALEEALLTASVGISVRILRIAWTGSKIQIFSHIISYLLACRLKNCRGVEARSSGKCRNIICR